MWNRHFQHPETRERRSLRFPTSPTLSLRVREHAREILFPDILSAADAYVAEVARWLSLGFRDLPPRLVMTDGELRLSLTPPSPTSWSWRLERGDIVLDEGSSTHPDAHAAVEAYNRLVREHQLPCLPPDWSRDVAAFPAELVRARDLLAPRVVARRFLHLFNGLELGPEHHLHGPPDARFVLQRGLQVRARVQGWATHLRSDAFPHQLAVYHEDRRVGLSFLFHEDGTIAEYRSYLDDTLEWLYRVDRRGAFELLAPEGESSPGKRRGVWTYPQRAEHHHYGGGGRLERIEFLRGDGSTRLEHKLYAKEPILRLYDALGHHVLDERSLWPERSFLSPDHTRQVTVRLPYTEVRVWWDGGERHVAKHRRVEDALLAHTAQVGRWLARGYHELAPWLLFAKSWRLVGLRPPIGAQLFWREASGWHEDTFDDLLGAVRAFNARRRFLSDQGYEPIEPLGWLEGVLGPGVGWREFTMYTDVSRARVRRRSFQRIGAPQERLGPVWSYNDEGRLRSRGLLLHGESCGAEATYYEDGETLKELALHERGELHGRTWSFRPDTGCIWGVFTHEHGRAATRLVLDGYDRPLVQTQDGLASDGSYLGVWEHFDARHRKVHRYDRGRLRSVEFVRLSDGVCEERHEVREDGSLRVTAFHDDGALRVHGHQNASRERVGAWEYFRASGGLLQRQWYRGDQLREIEVFREDGELEERIEVMSNGDRVVHRVTSVRRALRLVSDDGT